MRCVGLKGKGEPGEEHGFGAGGCQQSSTEQDAHGRCGLEV